MRDNYTNTRNRVTGGGGSHITARTGAAPATEKQPLGEVPRPVPTWLVVVANDERNLRKVSTFTRKSAARKQEAA